MQIPDYLKESAKEIAPIDVQQIKIQRTQGERVAEYIMQKGGTAETRELIAHLQLEQHRFHENMRAYINRGLIEYVPAHYRLTRRTIREYRDHGCFVSLSRDTSGIGRPRPAYYKANEQNIRRAILKIASLGV